MRDPRFMGAETQADILSLGAEHTPRKRRRLHIKQPIQFEDDTQNPDSNGQPESQPTPAMPQVVLKSRVAKAAEALGVTPLQLRYLVAVQAPLILWQCLFFMKTTLGPICRDLLCVDSFAGVGHVFSQWSGANLMAETFEILDDPVNENMFVSSGLPAAAFILHATGSRRPHTLGNGLQLVGVDVQRNEQEKRLGLERRHQSPICCRR